MSNPNTGKPEDGSEAGGAANISLRTFGRTDTCAEQIAASAVKNELHNNNLRASFVEASPESGESPESSFASNRAVGAGEGRARRRRRRLRRLSLSRRPALWLSSLWLEPWAEQLVRGLVLLAVAANVLAFPFLFAFNGPVGAEAGGQPGWLALLLCCDAVLWLDVAARFAVPHEDEDEGQLLSHRRVALRYLRSDLPVDVLCRWPWDAIAAACYGAPLRLSFGHLARLVSIRRALAILETRAGSRPRFVGAAQRLATLCTVSLVIVHWYACATWKLSHTLWREGEDSWVAQVVESRWEGSSVPWPWPRWACYLASVDRALNNVLAGEQRGATHYETALALLGQVGGVAWLAYFTSTMVQLVTNMNHMEEIARAKIGRVATFCRHARIPAELARRVNAHLEHVLLAKKIDLDTNELLAELSAPLRGEVALHRCHAFLLNPKFMGILGYDSEEENSVEQGMFIKALVRKLHLKVFSPGDFAMEEGESGEEVYFLSRGTVAIIAEEHQVATLSGGDCFGEIALLVPGMRRTASIVAITFCEAHELFRQDFIAALRSFPEMHTRIKRIAEERVAGLRAASEQKAREAKATEAAGAAGAAGAARAAGAAAAAGGGAGGEEGRGSILAPFSRASFSCAVGAIANVVSDPAGWAARIRKPRAQVFFKQGLVASAAASSAPPGSAAPGMQRRRSSFAVDNGGRGTFSAGGGGGEEPVVSAFAAMAKAAAEASLRTSAATSTGSRPSAAQ